jgi:hypothetical protein
MRTKEELLEEFRAELRGMLEEAFAEAEAIFRRDTRERAFQEYRLLGEQRSRTWRRAEKFLERIHAFYNPAPTAAQQAAADPIKRNGIKSEPTKRL